MKYLKTAYAEAQAKGRLTTTKVWLNFGYHQDGLTGKIVDDFKEIEFAELPKAILNLHVSNGFEKGTYCYWVEGGQLCVGKDNHPLDKMLLYKGE